MSDPGGRSLPDGAGRGEPGPPTSPPRGRRAPNWDEPGLAESLAAYMRFMDEVVTESQHCTRVEDVDRLAYLGDIIERAAARRRAPA